MFRNKKLFGIFVAAILLISTVHFGAVYAYVYDSGSSYLNNEPILDYDSNIYDNDSNSGSSSGEFQWGPENRSTSAVDKTTDGLKSDDVVLPEGAIGVYSTITNFEDTGTIYQSEDIICTQGSTFLIHADLKANFDDNTVYETTTGNVVGEFTVIPTEFVDVGWDTFEKKYAGHVFPYQLAGGEISIGSKCYPPVFVSQEGAVVEDVSEDEVESFVWEELGYPYDDFASYFSDLPYGAYYTEPAIELAAKDILPDEFIDSQLIIPAQNITRCELIEMVVRATGISVPESFDASFDDLPESHSKAKYVYAAKEQGWVNGKSSTFFDCDGDLIRAEMAKIMANALGLVEEDSKEFGDWGETPEWSKTFIKKVVKAGVMTGVGDKTNFAPMATLSRADSITAISRQF